MYNFLMSVIAVLELAHMLLFFAFLLSISLFGKLFSHERCQLYPDSKFLKMPNNHTQHK